ncbi:F-box protein At3g59000-like [Carex rostrata]
MKTGRNHGGKKNVAHDRISSLPDEILTHILSFLSTKEAVHTCVLSKRWRMMWATVPVLDFNLCEFFMDDQNDAPGDYGRKSVVRFERFVDGVLDNRKSTNLDIVRYSCRSQRCEALVYMGWLDRVVLLMPRMIHINFSRVFIFALNDPISCESLQHLVMDF